MTSIMAPPFDMKQYFEEVDGEYRIKPDTPEEIRIQIEEYQERVDKTFRLNGF